MLPVSVQGSRSAVKTVWGQSRRAPARLASTTWCSSTSPNGPGCDSSLASSVTLATSWPSSPTWATTRSSTSWRSASGRPGSAASSSALSRRLVSGVRSSWLASLTSCRCAVSDRCSAPSMVLNDAASRPSSSARSTSTRRPGSPVAVTSSATAGQPADRRQPGARHRPARQRGQPDPDHAEQGQRRADAGHLLVHGGERHGHLHGQARRERRGVDHGVDTVERGHGVVRPVPAGRDLHRGGVRRQQPAVARRRPDGTSRRHDLRVGAGHAEPLRMRRDPSGRDVPVVMAGHPVHHVALLQQLAVAPGSAGRCGAPGRPPR